MIAVSANTKASRIVEALRHQHAEIETMLAAFERQLSRFEAGGRPDYELIERIMAFCIDYLSPYHRAVEEPLLRTLYGRNVIGAAAAEEFETEYERIVDGARRLAVAIQDVIHEAEVQRQAFGRIAREFIAACRRHIRTEERLLVPAAITNLAASDWNVIDQAIADERSASSSECAYQARYEAIVAWDEADRLDAR